MKNPIVYKTEEEMQIGVYRIMCRGYCRAGARSRRRHNVTNSPKGDANTLPVTARACCRAQRIKIGRLPAASAQ